MRRWFAHQKFSITRLGITRFEVLLLALAMTVGAMSLACADEPIEEDPGDVQPEPNFDEENQEPSNTPSPDTGEPSMNAPVCIPCAPAEAIFAGEVIPQATIVVDPVGPTCRVVSGSDEAETLVIDDFRSGDFGMEGFGGSSPQKFSIVSVEGGNGEEIDGFASFRNLQTDAPVLITLQDKIDPNIIFTLKFTIVPGADEASASTLSQVGVEAL